jgi:bifunctional non-homologous end joining protein LigD
MLRVTPKLVCQVAFLEWTVAGHLRHCTFVAMRDDKSLRGWSAKLEAPRWLALFSPMIHE